MMTGLQGGWNKSYCDEIHLNLTILKQTTQLILSYCPYLIKLVLTMI